MKPTFSPWRGWAAFGMAAAVLGSFTASAHAPRPLSPVSTVVHFLPTGDTYGNEDFPDTSYGESAELIVARRTEFLTLRRVFLQFDLSGIPSGASVVSATLRLYHTAGSGPPVLVGARPITEIWTASSLTWRTQPDAGPPAASAVLTDRTGWRPWSVTGLAQAWIDGSLPNHGVSLRGPEGSDVEWTHVFDSRETARSPVLDIEYEVPTPTPTASATTAPCVDPYEPNNDQAHASDLAPGVEVTGCIPTPGDLDYFRFPAGPAERITVELSDLPVNLDLYLLDSSGQTLASSAQSGTTSERVELVAGPAGQQLFARIQSTGGWDLLRGYHLKLTRETGVPTPESPTVPPSETATATLEPTATETPSATRTASATRDTGITATPTKEETRPSPTTTPEWASVGGRVWEDADRDGRQDRSEDGIDRVEVSLERDGVVVGRATTDDDGYYVFATVTGELLYRVDVDDDTVPAPLIRTTCCDPVIVRPHAGQDLRGADVGYAMPVTPTPTATLPVTPRNMDLRITGIEITQATQCFGDPADLDGCEQGDNAIPLVAGKATVGRVYVTLSREGPGEPTSRRAWDVDVSLIAWDAGTGELLPDSPLQATINFVNADVPLSNIRNDAARTANFQLPDDWTRADASGISLSASLEDRVDECPTCADNNEFTERGVVFESQGAVHIYPVRIRYTRGDNDVLPSDDAAVGLYDTLMKLYPVAEDNVNVHISDQRVLRTDHNLGTNEGLSEVLDDLADRYVCYDDNFWACGWREGHYYGVISTTVQMGPASPEYPNGRWSGMGRVYDCVAIGREGRAGTAAHEIGHNLGREHASNDHGEADGGGWEEWPYPHGGIGTVGFDAPAMRARRLAAADALHWHDLMSYGGGLGKWISPRTYLALDRDLEFCSAGSPAVPGFAEAMTPTSSAPDPPTRGAGLAAASEPGHYWLVSGTLAPSPRLRPIYLVSARPGSVRPPTIERYAIVLLDAGGTELVRRTFAPIEDHMPAVESRAHFRAYVPDAPGATQVVVFDGETEIARRAMSANPPIVTISAPVAGTTWPARGSGDIRWSASDADGDELTYVVMYSRDGGTTWVNLATGLTSTHYDVELETLGGSPSQARVRVLANDGLRTGSDESESFSVAGHAPIASIELPVAADSPFAEGSPIRFRGLGADREDGNLTGRSLQWLDEAGRLLGSGPSLVLRHLDHGRFTVRLRATDSDGNRDEDTVTLAVGEFVWLPATHNRGP